VHFCGFRKEKDLLAYRLTRAYQPPEWALTLAERLSRKSEITIRRADRKTLQADLLVMNRIITECWAGTWGFVPMTDEEIMQSAKPLRKFVDPDLAFFIYYEDEPVGICLLMPDLNPLLKRLNGRLGPSALLKRYLYWSEIRGLRGLLFGVKEQYRQMGVPLVAFHQLARVAQEKQKYQYVEMGWTLEDNQAINRLLEEGGAKPHKRYRIYRKEL
jgi:hypothetical protein